MDADVSKAVHCEVPAGGVVFFCFGTPHATGANPSEHDRTGVGVHFVNGDYLNETLTEGKKAATNVVVSGPQARASERWQKYHGRWEAAYGID